MTSLFDLSYDMTTYVRTNSPSNSFFQNKTRNYNEERRNDNLYVTYSCINVLFIIIHNLLQTYTSTQYTMLHDGLPQQFLFEKFNRVRKCKHDFLSHFSQPL